jgi:hypothetical protein
LPIEPTGCFNATGFIERASPQDPWSGINHRRGCFFVEEATVGRLMEVAQLGVPAYSA